MLKIFVRYQFYQRFQGRLKILWNSKWPFLTWITCFIHSNSVSVHGTTSALLKGTEYIGKVTFMVLLDFSTAFEAVCFNLLCSKLNNYHFSRSRSAVNSKLLFCKISKGQSLGRFFFHCSLLIYRIWSPAVYFGSLVGNWCYSGKSVYDWSSANGLDLNPK